MNYKYNIKIIYLFDHYLLQVVMLQIATMLQKLYLAWEQVLCWLLVLIRINKINQFEGQHIYTVFGSVPFHF